MKRGFTLIEVFVAIVILVILTILGTAYLRIAARQNIPTSAARQIAGDLREASGLAATLQVNHSVNFNTINDSYEVIELSTPNEVREEVQLAPQLDIYATTFPSNRAEFDNLGAAVNPGTITLLYLNLATTIVEVRPSGYVRIQ